MDIAVERNALEAIDALVLLPAQQRTEFLTNLDDPQLASRVSQLLDAMNELEKSSGLGFEVSLAEQSFVGEQVGAYYLEEMIGQGGMGVVYRGRRTDGAFDRDVAIKFYSSVAPQALRIRFNAERQLLARLQHTNIAGLLDGGSVEINGQTHPYLVMEFVNGAEFQHEMGRPVAQVLRLFQKVCAGVHYAHTQLVLHRDLKPANVKLDDTGEPKLLDFGVAKLLQNDEVSNLTEQLPAVHTFNFTAPEVLQGDAASIVSEVYSLGVYLHVLIHGKTPYDLSGLSFPQIFKQLTEQPLTRSKPESELDAIVAKAMHNDPQRRYSSVAALAEDIDRYLAGYPVTAHGSDLWYLASRFVRRHALAVGFSAAAALGLTTTTAVAVLQAQAALKAEQSTQQTLRFVQSMFRAANPRSGEPLGPDASLRELMQVAQTLARDSFDGDSAVQLNVYLLLADTWLGMEQLDQVQSMLIAAEDVFNSIDHSVEDRTKYAELLTSLRISLAISGTQWREAIEQCLELPNLSTQIATNYAQLAIQIGCANAMFNTGESNQAVLLAEQAQRGLFTKVNGTLSPYEVLQSHFNLSNVYLGVGDNEATLRHMNLAEQSAKQLGESGLSTLALIYVMNSILPNQLGHAEESLAFTKLAMETAEASPLSQDQVLYAYVQLYHADRLIDVEQLVAAEEVFSNARRVLLEKTPSTSHYHATTHFTEYKIAYFAKDYERAESALLEAKRIRTAAGEAYTPWQATTDFGLGKVYMAQGRLDEADVNIRKAHDYYLSVLGPDHPKVQNMANILAEVHRQSD